MTLGTLGHDTVNVEPTVEVMLVWNFGYEETNEKLTKDQLWDLINNGRRDDSKPGHEVTSLVIFANTSDQFRKEWETPASV